MRHAVAGRFFRALIISLSVASLSAGVANGLFINGETSISGWAADLAHPTAPGIALLTVGLPASHSLPAIATLGLRRDDVAAAVGQRLATAGWQVAGPSFRPSSMFETAGVGKEGATFLQVVAGTAVAPIDVPPGRIPAGTVGRVSHPVFQVRGAIAHYVRNAYRHFLHREADPAGLDFWARFTVMNTLTGTRDHILDAPEARAVTSDEAYVRFLYWRYLGRAEDAGSFQIHLRALRWGTARSVVRDGFINSPEARLLVSDREFVAQAERQLWLRGAADVGNFAPIILGSPQADALVLSLQQGKPRSVLRDEFLTNSRFRLRNLGNASSATRTAVFDFSKLPVVPTGNG